MTLPRLRGRDPRKKRSYSSWARAVLRNIGATRPKLFVAAARPARGCRGPVADATQRDGVAPRAGSRSMTTGGAGVGERTNGGEGPVRPGPGGSRMGGTFACPECGNPVELKGLAPGREVRCGWCRTRVEVPFLPRAAGRRRSSSGRRRAPRWARWAWPVVGLAAILLVAAGTGRMFLRRTRQVHAEALERLTA